MGEGLGWCKTRLKWKNLYREPEDVDREPFTVDRRWGEWEPEDVDRCPFAVNRRRIKNVNRFKNVNREP